MKRAALIEYLTHQATRIGDELIQRERLAEFLPREEKPAVHHAIAAGRAGLCQRFREIFELQRFEVMNPGT